MINAGPVAIPTKATQPHYTAEKSDHGTQPSQYARLSFDYAVCSLNPVFPSCKTMKYSIGSHCDPHFKQSEKVQFEKQVSTEHIALINSFERALINSFERISDILILKQ